MRVALRVSARGASLTDEEPGLTLSAPVRSEIGGGMNISYIVGILVVVILVIVLLRLV
jgi:hypothetical protein